MKMKIKKGKKGVICDVTVHCSRRFQGFIVMSAIPDDHVCLLLIPGKSNNKNEKQEWFYLDIPIDIIETLCLKPRKYLLYLAWCILGLEVEYNKSLTLGLGDENGVFNEIDDDGDLESGGIYALIPDPPPGKYLISSSTI